MAIGVVFVVAGAIGLRFGVEALVGFFLGLFHSIFFRMRFFEKELEFLLVKEFFKVHGLTCNNCSKAVKKFN